ncbi:hypothetical protein UFOVP104_23 [uncultured Caudovirales phage]|uniref:Uncharacterized protein n=1 Tax=uncultured Caudovirales phage TaxID=2100421 RepID=A0A6J5L6F1_9CAUD|nr:hypothetical protein UFOVP104_23 [uncultured Caudovirales phage]CAB4133995.1 hypothetical protein UFOVP271_3 [uncultured Caudovirales phage]
MLIFTIIFFGLATIRTITPFGDDETYKKGSSFIAKIFVLITMLISYIWFLNQFITLK